MKLTGQNFQMLAVQHRTAQYVLYIVIMLLALMLVIVVMWFLLYNIAEGTWLVSSDKVKLAAIPVATVSCQTARLILLSMNVDLDAPMSANVTHTKRCKLLLLFLHLLIMADMYAHTHARTLVFQLFFWRSSCDLVPEKDVDFMEWNVWCRYRRCYSDWLSIPAAHSDP